jgi:hypothetical protein
MDENEYLLTHLIRQRVREAESHGVLQSLLRDARVRDARATGWWSRLTHGRGADRAPFASQAQGSVLG